MCNSDVHARAITTPSKRKLRSHEKQSSLPLNSSPALSARVHISTMLPRCILVTFLATLVLPTNCQTNSVIDTSDQSHKPELSLQPSDEKHSTDIQTIDYTYVKENRSLSNSVLSRRRRYVRFPAGSAHNGRYAYQHQRPDAGFYPEWTPVASHQGPFYHRPVPAAVMGQRSPRLVFRDQVADVPGGSPGVGFFHPNGIHEQQQPADDGRDYRRPSGGRYPLLGDQNMCSTGTCEFFLSCWMSSGLIEGGCGGFMFACCQRTAGNTAKTSDYHATATNNIDNSQLLQDYGPVVNDPRCGVSIGKIGPSLGAQRRIVGGDEAGFGSFPWQAYIRIGSSRCGGSLVNRFHVVTAGHCVARASARQVQVTLGDYVINSAVEPLPAYTFGVREIRVHPYFKFTPQADRFDVAVLRLDRPVQYMPHIAPICLPDKGQDFLGQYGWAAGWGALQAGSRLRPKTLQAVDVPVIDNRLCERWHKSNGINVVIYDEMMCSGYRGGGKDSCQGDSGGPLMMEKTGRWYLIGIVSAGYSCAQRGQPGIYHRVSHTVDWISHIINTSG